MIAAAAAALYRSATQPTTPETTVEPTAVMATERGVKPRRAISSCEIIYFAFSTKWESRRASSWSFIACKGNITTTEVPRRK